MNHLDPRSPLVTDTKALGRRPGSMEQVQRTVETPVRLGTDIIAVQEGQPLELDLRLESVVEGVLVTGSARATATGACVRCLDPVSHRVDVGDLLDLEPLLRDAVVPALPFQPVCRDDCPGLCSQCGARLADDPEHHHEVIDPRWSALQALSSETPSKTEEKRT